MQVVSNSSPLIVLYNCDQLQLLKQLFGIVLIPETVHQEIVLNTKDRQQGETIARCDFIRVGRIEQKDLLFSHNIDRGEAEAILLAITLQADYLILDDKRAQREAKKQGVTFIPTFSVLLKAAQKGMISDFDEILTKLQRKNIFLSRELSLAARNFLDMS